MVGHLFPGYEEKIVRETGEEAPLGQIGEILVKGPGMFKGYYKRSDINKAVFTDDGFFKTSDLGSVNEQGAITVVGRKRESVYHEEQARWILPQDVEEVVDTHST
jgi:long-chain acyl-CoA synthetase